MEQLFLAADAAILTIIVGAGALTVIIVSVGYSAKLGQQAAAALREWLGQQNKQKLANNLDVVKQEGTNALEVVKQQGIQEAARQDAQQEFDREQDTARREEALAPQAERAARSVVKRLKTLKGLEPSLADEVSAVISAVDSAFGLSYGQWRDLYDRADDAEKRSKEAKAKAAAEKAKKAKATAEQKAETAS